MRHHATEKLGIECCSFLYFAADIHLHPCGVQPPDAVPRDEGIAIQRGDDNASHTGCQQRLSAGRGPAVVAARFQGHVRHGSLGFCACSPQRVDLGMRHSRRRVVALSQHCPRAWVHHHAAYRRVWVSEAQTTAGQLKRPPHVLVVSLGEGGTVARICRVQTTD